MYYIEQSMMVTGIIYFLFSCILPFLAGVELLGLNTKKAVFMTVLFNGFVIFMNYGIEYSIKLVNEYVTII